MSQVTAKRIEAPDAQKHPTTAGAKTDPSNRVADIKTEPSLDVYSGWIVAWVDSAWRYVYVPPHLCTLAPPETPNGHVGVFKLRDIGALTSPARIEGVALESERSVIVASIVSQPGVRASVGTVRYGQIACLGRDPFPEASFELVDACPEVLAQRAAVRERRVRFIFGDEGP